MKKTNLLLAVAALTAASCSDNTDITSPIDPSGKEMISFSLSDGTQTRAGFRESNTRILMRIQSDDRSTSPSASKYTRVLASAAKDEMDISTDENKQHAYSVVSLNDDPRYWDDAHGRFSLLSVYAIAIANKNDAELLPLTYMYDGSGSKSAATNTVWGTSATSNADNNTILFTVETTAQTATTIANQDLVYSNNIQADADLGKDGIYRWNYSDNKYTPDNTGNTTHGNGRMLFFQNGVNTNQQPTDAPGHFDKGHLVFNHALSRLTVTLKEGEGFDDSSDTDFKFKNGTGNIKLLGMNTTGTLNVKTGVWAPGTATAINQMSPAATYSTAAGTFAAQMLPDYEFVDGSNTNVMEFTIDDNTYYITQDMVYDALVAVEANKVSSYGYDDATNSKFKMMQGHNYALTITVKKTKIQAITATLADWVDVTGEYAIDNSHITVTTKKIDGTGDAPCTEFNFYRLGQTLDKIYTDDSYSATAFSGDYKTEGRATKSETSTRNIWNTEWFYESNKIAYHFRTLNNLASGTDDANITNSSTTPAVSSFAMQSGSQASHDYHWGAPMDESATLAYNTTNGYTSSIHKGIVAPKNDKDKTINITELHMMSNINIQLVTDSVETSAGSGTYKLGPAAVNLENAQITITRFAKTGSVDMGTGKITPNYTAPSPLTHSLDGDADCAKIDAPSFTAIDSWWKHSSSIKASTDWFTYAVVPQALRRSDAATPAEADCVGITIRTTDNNEYYVIKDLADIIATSVTTSSSLSATRDQAQGAKILRWFPGHTYKYTIKITKKGIEAITCTVADWVTVTAKQIDITLEN